MGAMSIWHWIILLLIVLVLFGKGKISDVMGDVAKGINSFKKGLKDEETETAKTIDQKVNETVADIKEKTES